MMTSSMYDVKEWCGECDQRSRDHRVIGKLSFCCISVIGRGFSTVFKGKFEGTVDVAVKRILKEEQETGIITTVESETLSRVDLHPNVVRYYITEQDQDFWYIGMELCAGTLEDVIKGRYKRPSIGPRREVLRQITSGLEYLHGKDVVHRDLKPANIFISIPIGDKHDPLIKLANFGLSRQNKVSNSNKFVGVGTHGWMAPEIMINYDDIGEMNYDDFSEMIEKAASAFPIDLKAADIFSTGCLFCYFIADGLHPFGVKRNIENVKRTINGGMVLTVDDLSGDEEAFKLIESMVDPDPKQRPTATQVLDRINLLKNCGNFALGDLTGCDTCTDKPCRIGMGGFATVFKGKFKEESCNKIDVAIKSIELAKVRMPEKEVIEILNEMKTKGHKQENIVHFYYSKQNDKCLYIASELCIGTLGDLVKLDYEGKRIGAKRSILLQIVSGLVFLHTTLKVIHRDLKPDNILYTGTPEKPIMKLADFGLCRIVKGDQTHQTLTTTGTRSKQVIRAGTDDWMAPEMHIAMHFYFDSDIFPLGLIFGFTLTKGQHPFDFKHPREMDETELADLKNKRIDCIKGKGDIEMDVKVKQFTRQFIDSRVYKLIEWMLKKDRKSRPNASDVLGHNFFNDGISLGFSAINLKNAKEKEEELLQLCRHNNLQIAENKKKFDRLVMDDTVDINCVDADGNTPLILLCTHRSGECLLEDVDKLLTQRKDVQTKEKNKNIKAAADILKVRFDESMNELEKKTIIIPTLVLLATY